MSEQVAGSWGAWGWACRLRVLHVSEGDLLVARGLARRRGVGEILRGAAGDVLLLVVLAGVACGRVRQGDIAAKWVTWTGGRGRAT